MKTNMGLARAKELYLKRVALDEGKRADGKKRIGYFCCFVPLEILTAFDLVPYRITGCSQEPVTIGDAYVETNMCPFVRNCFDLVMKGRYGFLDGVVMPHSCDTVQRIYDPWKYHMKPPYSCLVMVPHMAFPESFDFFRKELVRFERTLEEFTKKKLSDAQLGRAIELHQRNRKLLRQLYELRKPDPPMISGVEVTEVLLAGMGIPVEEYNELLQQVISEAQARQKLPGKRPRVLLYGTEMGDAKFVQLIEQSGASVVMDDMCTGARSFWHDTQNIQPTSDSRMYLAKLYLDKINCPRTYRLPAGDGRESERFGYLGKFCKDFSVDGVILFIMRYCDTHEFDAPEVRDYLKGMGVPVLHLEDDYTGSASGQLQTRLEAFVEMMREKRAIA